MNAWILAKDLETLAAPHADGRLREFAARTFSDYQYPVDSQIRAADGRLMGQRAANELLRTGSMTKAYMEFLNDPGAPFDAPPREPGHSHPFHGPADHIIEASSPPSQASVRSVKSPLWMDLCFEHPTPADRIRIVESAPSGKLQALLALDESGQEHAIWVGNDPLQRRGTLEVRFPLTEYDVHRVRLMVDATEFLNYGVLAGTEGHMVPATELQLPPPKAGR